ncbi:Helicase PriA essential for oriC/DnaA-independent DNA replication, partial [hydrothermal vent metagenome]
MDDDSNPKQVVSVVLPLALEAAYSYTVPAGMSVAAGDYVNAPLGPRLVAGVVWEVGVDTPAGMRLRDIREKFDLPAMSKTQRKFLQWIADYYMSPLGMVLRGCLRAKGIFEPPRLKVAWQLTG